MGGGARQGARDPDLADFEKRKSELSHEAEQMKWFETVRAYAKDRCTELNKAGRIKVTPNLMTYDLPANMAKLFGNGADYEPCSTFAR